MYWGVDLSSEHERYLAEEHFKSAGGGENYPKDIKAFYMRLNEDGKTVAAMDVLAPGIGEIIGGSQREGRLDVLDARMAEMGLNKEDYWWYRDLRRYGTRAAFRLRSGLRTPHRLRDRRAERPRCYSVPADAAQPRHSKFSDINPERPAQAGLFMSITVVKFNNLKTSRPGNHNYVTHCFGASW